LLSSSWQGKVFFGGIRTLVVNCAPILDCSKDDGRTAAVTVFNEMVMGAVESFHEISLLVSQPNHSNLSITVLDNALRRYVKLGAVGAQKISKSAKAKVDEHFERACKSGMCTKDS